MSIDIHSLCSNSDRKRGECIYQNGCHCFGKAFFDSRNKILLVTEIINIAL